MRYRKLSAIVLFSSFFAISFYVSAKPKSDRQQVIDHIHSIFPSFRSGGYDCYSSQAHRGLERFSK